MTNEELWQTVLAQIQLTISPASFSTWFKQTVIISQKDGKAIISVPNSFCKEWLKSKYHKLITQIINDQDSNLKEVDYIIGKTYSPIQTVEKKLSSNSQAAQLDFQEFKVDRETNLNPRYLFENFIVGSFNEMAHAAAVAVAKAPGEATYNPLFIYGGVGLGKTHLLQAVGNEIARNTNKNNIRYLPAEKFTSEIVNAIKNHQIDALKTKWQKTDVLIIDDIQFLAGKEKTQEEFFHLFNALYEKNKQIILSSDRPPKAIASLTERLRSRFEGGMTADVSFPDLETRIAILKTKLSEKKLDFPEEVINYIAASIQDNIRELEGAINRLSTYQRVNSKALTVELVKGLLENLMTPPVKISSPKKIVQIVSDFYDLKDKDIFDVTRKKEVVKPRQIVMFFLREELKYSFPAIGRIFKGKDHTTAIHAYKKIRSEISTNSEFAEEINLIKRKIYEA